MGKRLVNHDPLTGVSTYHSFDNSSQTTYIEQVQDVEKILKHCKTLANDSEYKRQGVKNDFYHFATVPNTVILELKQKHGLDIFNKDDLKKIESILQSDYSKLLTVDRI